MKHPPHVPTVTIENLFDLSFQDFLAGLEPYLLEPIPEGTGGDEEALMHIDRLLGRFANLYSYLIYLWAYSSHEVKRLKILGAQEEYSVALEKRDALFEFARAVKLKKEGASRMLTVFQEEGERDNFDRVDYEGRKKRTKKPPPSKVGGWNNVS